MYTTGAVAQTCTSGNYSYTQSLIDDSIRTFPNFGGVSLDKTLTLLNEVNDVKGAAYDPVKGEVVFIGEGQVPIAERIDLDDLVVAVRSIYGKKQDPGITFYTADKVKALTSGKWDVNYFGATKDTQFGQILFEADYVLKQLSLGVTPTGQRVIDVPAIATALPAGYASFSEHYFAQNLSLNGCPQCSTLSHSPMVFSPAPRHPDCRA